MSAASARAALIDLASAWRREGLQMDTTDPDTRMFVIYAECAKQLDETTIAHLSDDDTIRATLLEIKAVADAFTAAMALEGVPAWQAERVVNIVLHGHPGGVDDPARICPGEMPYAHETFLAEPGPGGLLIPDGQRAELINKAMEEPDL